MQKEPPLIPNEVQRVLIVIALLLVLTVAFMVLARVQAHSPRRIAGPWSLKWDVAIVLAAAATGATLGYLGAGTVGMVIWGLGGAVGFGAGLLKMRAHAQADERRQRKRNEKS